mmetsp:Transcript_3262/g.10172  ORF Transcript_3262/g.10172 Transcript_3262/m.10172 type:complete len:283 (+) Transcript_3262:665-1513(+)
MIWRSRQKVAPHDSGPVAVFGYTASPSSAHSAPAGSEPSRRISRSVVAVTCPGRSSRVLKSESMPILASAAFFSSNDSPRGSPSSRSVSKSSCLLTVCRRHRSHHAKDDSVACASTSAAVLCTSLSRLVVPLAHSRSSGASRPAKLARAVPVPGVGLTSPAAPAALSAAAASASFRAMYSSRAWTMRRARRFMSRLYAACSATRTIIDTEPLDTACPARCIASKYCRARAVAPSSPDARCIFIMASYADLGGVMLRSSAISWNSASASSIRCIAPSTLRYAA